MYSHSGHKKFILFRQKLKLKKRQTLPPPPLIPPLYILQRFDVKAAWSPDQNSISIFFSLASVMSCEPHVYIDSQRKQEFFFFFFVIGSNPNCIFVTAWVDAKFWFFPSLVSFRSKNGASLGIVSIFAYVTRLMEESVPYTRVFLYKESYTGFFKLYSSHSLKGARQISWD